MIRLMTLFFLAFLAAPAAATASGFQSDRISVAVVGTGPDVVLVPGLGSSPSAWRGTVERNPGYRYHLVHVAGFAGKPAGANASGPVVEPVAAEIARYIREAGLDRPAIVGHSLGGSWAMMVAARNPGLVSRVMVVDMVPFMAPFYGGPTATVESVRPAAEQARRNLSTAGDAARRQSIEAVIATMVKTESLRPAVVAESLASDPVVAGQAMYELITLDLRPELARIDVPVTVLWVRNPAAPISVEQMSQFFSASYAGLPQVTVTQIPDAYHFIMGDAPERFDRELRAFLDPQG